MDIVKKKPLKTFGNADSRKFFLRLAFYHCSWVLKTLKILGFLEKETDFFEKNLKVFKNTQHVYFASESNLKVILAYAISKCPKPEIFRKNDVFSEKFLKVFRSTMLSIFDLECVSEFQIAEEISKQSTFWVFRRNRCLWKEPRFFPKSVNVASFF